MVSYPLVADYIHLQNPTSCLHKSTNMHLLRHGMKAIKMWKIAFFFKKNESNLVVAFFFFFFWWGMFLCGWSKEAFYMISVFASRTSHIKLSPLILVVSILQWFFVLQVGGPGTPEVLGWNYKCSKIGSFCIFKLILIFSIIYVPTDCNHAWGTCSAWGEVQKGQ